jgi:Domain of unknown function (DUF4421)
MKTLCLAGLILLVASSMAVGQQAILIRHAHPDTSYIVDYYKRHLILRAYESTKFNNFKFTDNEDKLIYRPNDHYNLGIGVNYRFICVNIGFYVPLLSKNGDKYGKTKAVDLQTHFYFDKFIVDFYAQFYTGYYLANTNVALEGYPQPYEVRPDMRTRDISLAVQYVFNDKHFSYNAPYFQNERQKKSAGSFLLGGGLYHTDAHADSSMAPAMIKYSDFFGNIPFSKINNFSIAINAGYGYTLVLRKYFFITEMLSAGPGVNFSYLYNPVSQRTTDKFGAEFNVTERFAAGYNNDHYFLGVNYIRLITEDNSAIPQCWQQTNTGNFRIVVAKRFRLKKALIPKGELIDGVR